MARQQAFSPGELIADELEARGWSQSDFAKILGRPFQHVNLVINGRRRLNARTAAEVAAAFGTSTAMWLNLQADWDAYNAPAAPKAIAARAERLTRASA